MKVLSTIILASSLMVSGAAMADAAAGKAAFAAKGCIGCHGAGGHSAIPTYPKLTGQHQAYLAKQLHDFKNGVRKDPTMAAMVAAITDADITNITEYLASEK